MPRSAQPEAHVLNEERPAALAGVLVLLLITSMCGMAALIGVGAWSTLSE